MPGSSPVSAAITARIIHIALALGVMLFWAVAWFIGTSITLPVSALPDRRVLYLGLLLISAVLFGADFRTLIAPFTGLLLFVNYRPSRLAEA